MTLPRVSCKRCEWLACELGKWRVSFAVEIGFEKHVNFVNQENAGARARFRLSLLVGGSFASHELACHLSNVTAGVQHILRQLVEGPVVDPAFNTEGLEHGREVFEVTFAEVTAITSTVHIMA